MRSFLDLMSEPPTGGKASAKRVPVKTAHAPEQASADIVASPATPSTNIR
jgi:hypothetical protein